MKNASKMFAMWARQGCKKVSVLPANTSPAAIVPSGHNWHSNEPETLLKIRGRMVCMCLQMRVVPAHAALFALSSHGLLAGRAEKNLLLLGLVANE